MKFDIAMEKLYLAWTFLILFLILIYVKMIGLVHLVM